MRLEGIGPADVVDGNEDLILGLLWTIILRYGVSYVKEEFQHANSVKGILKIRTLWDLISSYFILFQVPISYVNIEAKRLG